MEKVVKQSLMYFSELSVKNVKSFGNTEQKLDLKNSDGSIAQWTLILGDNGVGKTTLLKCLAWMIPVEAPSEDRANSSENEEMDNNRKTTIVKPYMDDLDESNFEQLIRIGDDIETSIVATLTDGTLLKEKPTDHKSVTVEMRFKKINGKLEEITPVKEELAVFTIPNIFAYSANRHLATKNIDNSELKSHISNLFSDSGDLYDAEQLLSMLDTASSRPKGNEKANNLLIKIKEILTDLLPNIKDPSCIIINSPINDDGSINDNLIEVQTEDGRVKLFDLSLGYITMLTWIVDLAVRMLWQFPESDEPLKQPAIVIVDEIDLHLHPTWQRMIMEKLTSHFTATQFICTAHSPIMAQASELQNLAVVKRLEKNENVIITNRPHIVKGWRIGQLLTSELFDFDSERGPEIDTLLEMRRNLLKKEKLTDSETNELAKINIEIDKIPLGESEEENTAANILRDFSKKLAILKSKDDKN